MKKETNTSWGKIADWYDNYLGDSDNYQNKVILPNVLRIINPKKGMDILDLACGQGFFSFKMAELGANITGVDIAEELIEKAKENASVFKKNNKDANIEFYTSPATELDFLKEKKFDFILIVLAIQNIENPSKVFENCKKLLKENGKLLIVLNHPIFRIPKNSDWYYNENIKQQGRVIYQYMKEIKIKIDSHPGNKKENSVTFSFHRPLQVYFKWLSNNGFVINKLEEWISHKESENGPKKITEDNARKEIPIFMCIESTLN